MDGIKSNSDPEDTLIECFHFFNVENVRAWENKYNSLLNYVAFRTSKTYESIP